MTYYPYTTSIPSIGDIVQTKVFNFLVTSHPEFSSKAEKYVHGYKVEGNKVDTKQIYHLPCSYGSQFTILGKMFCRNGLWEPLPAEQGEFVPLRERLTLADSLPAGHPLRNASYWDGSEESSLNAIKALEWAKAFVQKMDSELPCQENQITINLINSAIIAQQERYNKRKEQRVLGTDIPHKTKTSNDTWVENYTGWGDQD
jgi:hypothetical protein